MAKKKKASGNSPNITEKLNALVADKDFLKDAGHIKQKKDHLNTPGKGKKKGRFGKFLMILAVISALFGSAQSVKAQTTGLGQATVKADTFTVTALWQGKLINKYIPNYTPTYRNIIFQNATTGIVYVGFSKVGPSSVRDTVNVQPIAAGEWWGFPNVLNDSIFVLGTAGGGNVYYWVYYSNVPSNLPLMFNPSVAVTQSGTWTVTTSEPADTADILYSDTVGYSACDTVHRHATYTLTTLNTMYKSHWVASVTSLDSALDVSTNPTFPAGATEVIPALGSWTTTAHDPAYKNTLYIRKHSSASGVCNYGVAVSGR